MPFGVGSIDSPISFYWEESKKPWFGPTKRAKDLLVSRGEVTPPKLAAVAIAKYFGDDSRLIQQVRFIDFVHRDKGNFRFTIALVWTDSDEAFRQRVYDSASELIALTGWYPLPQGERIGSRIKMASLLSTATHVEPHCPSIRIDGRLASIENAVDEEAGCAIRVRTTRGSFLLDSGLTNCSLLPNTNAPDQVVFLSHIHSDHAGGLSGPLGQQAPVVMSEVTFAILKETGRLRSIRQPLVISAKSGWIRIGQDIEIKAVPVPHMPGAIGFMFRDGDRALIYTGDISLASNRHDFIPDLARHVDDIERPASTLLLDATMAGRNLGSSTVSLAEQVISASNDFEDVFLVASDIEQLLYAYLDLFFYIKESPQLRYTVSFFMPHRLKHLFQVIHANFISRQLSEADPFLLHQYGKSMSAWAESRSLYWLEQKSHIHGNLYGNKRMWFCSANALPQKASESTSAVLGLGRWSDQSKLRDICGGHVLNVDTFAWAQHSDAKLIEHVTGQLANKTRVVLFHNFERRLSKFISQKNLSNCHFLSRTPLAL